MNWLISWILKILRYILSPLWKTWFALWFALSFLLLYPFFYYTLTRRKQDAAYTLKRLWGRMIAYGSFLFPVINYKSGNYPFPKPCVIVSNHTSYLDIILSTFYIDHTAIYMGKYELLKIPLFGNFFRYLDIPLNRRSLTDAHRAYTEAGRKLDKGLSMVIYPEGTISSSGHLKPFKNGAFRLAISKQVPIVPTVNLNNWHFLQNGGFLKSNGRPGIPRIIIGDPIETRGMDESHVGELREKVFTFIRQELVKYYGKQN